MASFHRSAPAPIESQEGHQEYKNLIWRIFLLSFSIFLRVCYKLGPIDLKVMIKSLLPIVFLLSFAIITKVMASDISPNYFVIKDQRFVQNSTSAPVLSS